MKKIKQTLSLILAVIMLITAVPVQSFAAFDFLYPAVESIEYVGEAEPISYKGVLSKKLSEDDEYVPLFDSNRYNIVLSNGKTIANTSGFASFKSGIRMISVTEQVKIDDCIKAIEQGKSTVEIIASVYVTYLNRKYNYFTFTLERPIVKEFVTDISFADTMPEITEDNDWNYTSAFVGKKFDIVYADGTKKTEAIVETDEGFFLDGEHIYISDEDGSYIDEVTGAKVYYTGYTVEFIDAETILDKQIHTKNYKSLELLDYGFDDSGKLTSVTYRLTHNDGSITEKTCSFDALGVDEKTVIDTVDGYDIEADLYVSPCFLQQNSYCFITISYGCVGWGLRANETLYDFSEICDCRCHKSGIVYIFNQIIFKLQEMLGKTQECQCGASHDAVS